MNRLNRYSPCLGICFLTLFAPPIVTDVLAADDRLPDIIIRESDLYDNDIVTNIIPGHTHLRLSNGTANVGEGKLYLWGGDVLNDSTQIVNQRVYRSDGSFYDRRAGSFLYHEAHGHIHFNDWCTYRLREVLPGNGVGDTIAEGSKTSFCILDLGIYDNSLPFFEPNGQFFSCSSDIQGLSVGWIDIYSKGLPDQNIDITGVPDGTYWLESESDPDNHVLEFDETNNITRVLVTIGQPAPINADAYEPNNSRGQVDGMALGGPNSPNLGPCDPQETVEDLTIHESDNDDYFRFYMNSTGSADDFVQILFSHALGDLDMQLLNSAGSVLAEANSVSNNETISLNGRSEGWYYVRAYGWNGATNPDYTLVVDPPDNGAPTITVMTPPAGDTVLIHGFETYQSQWMYNDPEGDEAWVTVYLNTQPMLDGNETLLPVSLNTDADVGFHVVNTSYVDFGTYWVYCSITDGGTTTGDWSEGTLTLAADADNDGIADPLDNCPGDSNSAQADEDADGVGDACDNCLSVYNPAQADADSNGIGDLCECACPNQGDWDTNTPINIIDIIAAIDFVFRSGAAPTTDPQCPANRGDWDCDGGVVILDVVAGIDYVFRSSGVTPCDPCACSDYPNDCP